MHFPNPISGYKAALNSLGDFLNVNLQNPMQIIGEGFKNLTDMEGGGKYVTGVFFTYISLSGLNDVLAPLKLRDWIKIDTRFKSKHIIKTEVKEANALLNPKPAAPPGAPAAAGAPAAPAAGAAPAAPGAPAAPAAGAAPAAPGAPADPAAGAAPGAPGAPADPAAGAAPAVPGAPAAPAAGAAPAVPGAPAAPAAGAAPAAPGAPAAPAAGAAPAAPGAPAAPAAEAKTPPPTNYLTVYQLDKTKKKASETHIPILFSNEAIVIDHEKLQKVFRQSVIGSVKLTTGTLGLIDTLDNPDNILDEQLAFIARLIGAPVRGVIETTGYLANKILSPDASAYFIGNIAVIAGLSAIGIRCFKMTDFTWFHYKQPADQPPKPFFDKRRCLIDIALVIGGVTAIGSAFAVFDKLLTGNGSASFNDGNSTFDNSTFDNSTFANSTFDNSTFAGNETDA